MKTICSTIAVLAMFLVAPTVSSGTYDGVWISPFIPGEYLVVRHPDASGVIGLAQLSGTNGIWDALLGTLSGNVAAFDGISVLGGVDMRGTIEFSSSDAGTLTVQECVSLALECDLPANTPIPIERLLYTGR